MQGDTSSLGKRLIRGGIALSFARLVTRALGIVSALTVPRWLGPEEMGIFAVAMLAITAINAFTESGFVSAFIQRNKYYEKYISPIRTFNALRGLFLGLLLFLGAPYIAVWMDTPRSSSVLKVLALAPLLNGLKPMIWTLACKRLLFSYQAKYNAFLTVVNIAITIPLAWYLKNVWALVLGMLVLNLIDVVLSTLLSREGRGFTTDLKPLRELQSFSFWIFLTSIVSYVYINGGNWLIGNMLNVEILAVYTLAFKFSTMFTGEAAAIINQMMLPVFSHLQDDLPRFRKGFIKSFGLLAMISIGVGAFFCVAAQDYFSIVLATKWASYATLFKSLLPWLTLWGVCSAFAGVLTGVFQALGKPNWWLWTVVGMCLLMVFLVWPAIHFFGAVGVAALLGGVAFLMLVIRYIIILNMLKLRALEIVSHVVTPAVAGVLAVTAANFVRGHLISSDWGQAMLASSVVIVTYCITITVFSNFLCPDPIYLSKRMWAYAIGRINGRKR